MNSTKKMLRPSVLALFTVFFAGMFTPLWAATYYVDASVASTGNGSSASPFKTIQEAAAIAVAGDIVNIRPGIYRESVRPTNSGTSSNRITFQKDPASIGTVVVSGANLVTGWTLDGTHASGKVYRAAMPWNLNVDNDDPEFGGVSGNQVFVNGRMVLEARWPNSGADVSLPTLAHSSNGGTVDNNNGWLENGKVGTELAQGTALAGAVIHMSPGESWNNYTARVTSVSGNRINFNGNLYYPWDASYHPTIDTPFYVFGKKQFLDVPGEWWFDEASQQLYLWAPTGVDPSSLTVESKRRIFAFDLSSRNYITIKNIDLFAASITTTRTPWSGYNFASHSSGHTLDGVKALYVSHARFLSGTQNNGDGNPFPNGDSRNTYYWTNLAHNTGIIMVGTDHVIRNCVIGYSAGNLLLVAGRNALVENNILHDANYLGVDAANLNLGHFGAESRDHIVRNNTAYRSGRAIFLIRTIKNTQILNNHLYVSNLQSTDVGAMYMYENDAQGSVIAYNIVQDVAGPKHGGAGIYMDERSQNVRIHHNLVYNSQGALRLNEPRQMRVYNNTLVAYDTSLSGMRSNGTSGWITWDVYSGTANFIRNNIFSNVYEFRRATFSNNLPNTQNPLWNSYGGGSIPFPLAYDNPAPDFKFVDPLSGNFHLQSTSPAVNAGVSMTDGGIAMPDYSPGGNNGAPDIGCYEYGRTAWTAGASLPALEPNAPSNLRLVSASGTQIALAWNDNSSNETAFYLERSADFRTFDVVAVLPPNTTAYTDITQPNTYFYRVRADNSRFAPVLKVSPGRSALAKFEAEGFDETGGGNGGVVLQGTGITDFGAGEYMLFRGVIFTSDINKFVINMQAGYNSPIEFRLGSPTAPVVASFTGPNSVWGEPGQTYEGAVSGFPNGVHDLYITVGGGGHPGNIDWFMFANGSTLPNKPTSLSENAGQLSWGDNSGNELGFKVEYSLDNIVWIELAVLGSNVTTYAATPNKFYRVRAFNALGNSDYSNIAGSAPVASGSYSAWASSTIGGSNAGMLDDPDGDGVVNLMEYALGMSPVQKDLSGLPTVGQSPAGHVKLTVKRDNTRTDVSLYVERSTNLGVWTVIAQSIGGAAFQPMNALPAGNILNGATNTVEVTDNTTPGISTPVFLRVRVVSQ